MQFHLRVASKTYSGPFVPDIETDYTPQSHSEPSARLYSNMARGRRSSRFWGWLVGAATTSACLLLAPLDGGVSAFASMATFKSAFAAGAITLGEAKTSIVAGRAAKKVVDGALRRNERKKRSGRSTLWRTATEEAVDQVKEGHALDLITSFAG